MTDSLFITASASLQEVFNLSWDDDGWIMLAGALCGIAASLLGNFLVLRRLSLLGDAISHAILPGLAAAFLLTGQRQGWGVFLGASAVGLATVVLAELARRYGRVDEGASIGVVFTFLFALGLIMIVRAADRVDLDPGCVLYGSIETIFLDTIELGSLDVPRAVINLGTMTVINLLFVVLLYRPLKVSTFDPQLAQAQGVPVKLLHYVLAGLVAITSVAAFESVGNILVVAMFVVPPVTAWLCTDRLGRMIALSTVFAALSAVLGHLSAIGVPAMFGLQSTNTAGMMAAAAGAILTLAVFFAPRKGLLSRAAYRFRVSMRIVGEDILGSLYRAESAGDTQLSTADLQKMLYLTPLRLKLALMRLARHRWVQVSSGSIRLTVDGRATAQNLVRAHRLWEHYLSAEAGQADHDLHAGAEQLEHFTNRDLRERLHAESNAVATDPHGKSIPPEAEAPRRKN